MRKKQENDLLKNPIFYIVLIAIASTVLFIYQLTRLAILPNQYVLLILCGFTFLFIICGIIAFRSKSKWFSKTVAGIIAIILTITSGIGSFYLNSTYDSLSMMSESNGQIKKTTSLYVLKSGAIEDARDLTDHTLGIMENFSESKGASGIGKKLYSKKANVKYKKYNSAIRMIKDLKGQAIDGVIMDESYLSTIEDFEEEKDIRDQIVSILDYKYFVEKEETNKDSVNVTDKPFSVLISGIDTYGDIQSTSRSDVNIVAVVHPKNHKILLISIPRDYYVYTRCEENMGCANGEKDKLTHTGLYGVECTEMTVESFMDMEINYNARVNFSSLVQIVDELGGVDVVNPNTFQAGGYSFEASAEPVHLNGKQALAYCRERYSFTEGDRERGRNQMRVLNGIIQKALSVQILKNFTGIMNAIGHSFQTNMSVKDMTSLVNMQLKDGGAWQVYSCSLNGTTGTDYAYALGDNASVMYPDKKTITQAKENIDAILLGDIPPYAKEN